MEFVFFILLGKNLITANWVKLIVNAENNWEY